MEHKVSESYKKIWKHLADKYSSEVGALRATPLHL